MRLIDKNKLPRRRYPEYDETGEFINVLCVKTEDIDNAPTDEVWLARGEWVKEPWVSVIERLPDDGREVLICTRSGRRYVAAWRDDAQWWDSYDYGWIDSDEIITHWCELPEVVE